MNPLSRRRSALFAAGLVLLALAVPTRAADPKSADKALDQYLYSSLRYVINHGVDLYNAGRVDESYDHFRQSLQDLVPVLAGHADLQKTIKEALDKVEKDPDWRAKKAAAATMPNPQLAPANRQKAFALRAVFNEVRAGLQGGGGKPAVTADEGAINGNVRLDGKPLATAKVTLSGAGGKPLSTYVADDGSFKLTKVPAGTYRVAVTGTGVPAHYGSATTSGITTNVTRGSNLLDLDLKGEKKPEPMPEVGNVQGTVKFEDGGPLPKGKVTFADKGSGKVHSAVVADAFYSLKLPAGSYRVTITGDGVPAAYGDVKTTPLVVEMAKGDHKIDLVVKVEKKPAPKPEDKPKPGESNVAGKVTVDGKPLAKGKVTFIDPNDKEHAADVKDGSYKLTLPSEQYTVTVSGEGVPAAYGDAKKSNLANHVMPGANAFDLKLVGEKKPAPKPEGKPEEAKAPKVPEAIAVPAIHADGLND